MHLSPITFSEVQSQLLFTSGTPIFIIRVFDGRLLPLREARLPSRHQPG